MANILGVDFGEKRIGLAWAEEGLDVVLPFGILGGGDDSSAALIALIQDENIHRVVFGLPIGLDGKETARSIHVRAYGQKIQDATGVTVEFSDERFTSKLADMLPGDATRDEKAAMAILEGYLHR